MENNENSELKVYVLYPNIQKEELNNIKIIRIKDKKYNFYVMKDYWPIIGEINGSIYFEGETTKSFENINAFYSLSHNEFNLIIRKMEQ